MGKAVHPFALPLLISPRPPDWPIPPQANNHPFIQLKEGTMKSILRVGALACMLGWLALALGCTGGTTKPGPGGPGTGAQGGTSGGVAQVKKLNVGGATFIAPMMEKWSYEYKKQGGTEINYNAV